MLTDSLHNEPPRQIGDIGRDRRASFFAPLSAAKRWLSRLNAPGRALEIDGLRLAVRQIEAVHAENLVRITLRKNRVPY
jgi:hypothetical protein